jgi:signal transduction histidine kinase
VESEALVERQEKLASLGMLAAGVAHEIRNPLTAIKAALFIQQKKFHPGTQEFNDARLVEREILRLERIVNDFLLFARPAEPELTNLSTAVVFREIQSLFDRPLAKNNIQIQLEESPPLRIRADFGQIKQVLINLVQNAADAIGRDGVITLRARRARKRLANSETNVVVLEVVDNGPGIPADVQQRLFDPFFTTKDTGTGLGLSIAAGIVQKHGGALQYQTQLDYGTTFGILLPEAAE